MLELAIVSYVMCVLICLRSLYFQLKNKNLEVSEIILHLIVTFLPFINILAVSVIIFNILERYQWNSNQMRIVKERTRWQREKDIW